MHYAAYFLFFTFLSTTFLLQSLSNVIRVDSSSTRFIDEYGRERIFHGINAVYKGPPYLPVAPGAVWVIDQSVLTQFKALGVNVLRVGLMYAGAMPEKGQLNATYFDTVETFIRLCQDNGVYTLLDSHQDLFTEGIPSGDGFPVWSVIQGNAKAYPYPLDSTDLPWALYYMTEIVNSGFGHFYNNTDSLQDFYAAFWSEAGKRFAKYPLMLGYELINEPWAGDVYEDLLIALPFKAYRQNLQPLYDKLAAVIWLADPDHLVFFETVTWDNDQLGVQHVPGYSENSNKTVLSYHFYTPPQFDIDIVMSFKASFRDRFKCGSMLTEFEAWNGNTEKFQATLKTSDIWKESWIAWMANPLALLSSSEEYKATFAHPYAQIVAGSILLMNFEPVSRNFTLNYTANPKITSNESVIFVNKEIHYPSDFTVTSNPTQGVTIKRDDSNHHVIVEHDASISSMHTTVMIAILPK